jgi:hypothetical protein
MTPILPSLQRLGDHLSEPRAEAIHLGDLLGAGLPASVSPSQNRMSRAAFLVGPRPGSESGWLARCAQIRLAL